MTNHQFYESYKVLFIGGEFSKLCKSFEFYDASLMKSWTEEEIYQLFFFAPNVTLYTDNNDNNSHRQVIWKAMSKKCGIFQII